MSYRYSVVVPYLPACISGSDIATIGRTITEIDPTLLWKPVNMKARAERERFRLPTLPSILLEFNTFQPQALRHFKGPRLEMNRVHKVQQLRVLDAAEIRAPKWTRLLPDTQINAAEFGENVIIKPTDPSASLGRGITLVKTKDFEDYRDRNAKKYEAVGRSPPLVQQHIPTGGMPEHFRVVTFLDKVVGCRRSVQKAATPVNAPVNNLVLTEKVASNVGELERGLHRDPEIEAFGLLIASAFDSTVKGIDILRSSEDGELYALEVNMGNVWAFSSQLGMRRTLIDAETMRNQFNLYDTVANATVKKAKELLEIT